jgi:hypothetical protein
MGTTRNNDARTDNTCQRPLTKVLLLAIVGEVRANLNHLLIDNWHKMVVPIYNNRHAGRDVELTNDLAKEAVRVVGEAFFPGRMPKLVMAEDVQAEQWAHHHVVCVIMPVELDLVGLVAAAVPVATLQVGLVPCDGHAEQFQLIFLLTQLLE